MEDAKEARALQEPLLPTAARDWRGRPAHGRLGGWKCASCILGATGLCLLAFYGVLFNLVIFLVQTGETNAAAATTVATLSGTQYLCSFLGAFLSDAFMGRLWTSLVFQVLLTKSIILVGVSMMTASSATGLSRVFLSMSLYMMAITTGPVLPNILCLGVDQLDSKEDKEMYFQLMAVATAVGQLLAATVVTYVDSEGMWVWGFGLCAVASLTSLILVAGGLRWFRRYRATGNPFLRNSQVLVAALRKHRLAVPTDSTLLHEYKGDISAIPGCRKLPHTPTLSIGGHGLFAQAFLSTLNILQFPLRLTLLLFWFISFLDKAAVLEVANTSSQWRLCTVTQVEELKSLLRVIPATFAMLFTTLAVTQVSTLFEEQAVLMNRNFGSSFAVPPASLNVLAIISGIITGLVTAAGGGARLSRWCLGRIEQTPSRRASSLFLLGISLMCSISSMVISALVEMCRLNVAHNGIIISVLWLVPQTILLGVATNLATSSSLDFCYSEISESMRSVGGSIVLISCGAGSYLNSILVAVVTTITSCGGRAGWIANNLDEGHADYFYWCLACCLAFGLGVHIAYARAYKYTGRK